MKATRQSLGKQVVGVDIAKNVFQVVTVDPETGEVFNKPILRALFLNWFANRAPCLVATEACGQYRAIAAWMTASGPRR